MFIVCVHCIEQNECNWYNHHLMESAINVVGIQFQNQFVTHRPYALSGMFVHVTIPFLLQRIKKCLTN